jgi:hypothetical protein
MSDEKPPGYSLDEPGWKVALGFLGTGIASVFGLNPADHKPEWRAKGSPEDIPGYVPKGTI